MTQSLICVWYEGKFQVLQHAHWNGAPTGQGLQIWKILQRPGFVTATSYGLHLSMPINDRNKCLYSADDCPSLSHKTGAAILNMLQNATCRQILPLYLDYEFINNTQYCEHAYVVNLDGRGSFEIYVGQEPKSQAKHNRFLGFGKPEDTIPKFLISFPLDNLPETPEDFLSAVSAKLAERTTVNANLS